MIKFWKLVRITFANINAYRIRMLRIIRSRIKKARDDFNRLTKILRYMLLDIRMSLFNALFNLLNEAEASLLVVATFKRLEV